METPKTASIPHLAPRDFNQYSPDEFRDYVTSLKIAKAKSASTGLNWRRSPKGNLTITCRRPIKTISEAEIKLISEELGMPDAEIRTYVMKKKFGITGGKK